MEIRQVLYFLCVAERGSFSAAAEALFISQSSLSKQVMALEKELGVQLFDRSRRKIALTRAGEAFLKHARAVDKAYQEMLGEMGGYKSLPFVSIVAIPVMAQYGITAAIAQFKHTFPQLNFTLEEREAASILPALDNHQYDLALLRDSYLDQKVYASIEVAKDWLLAVLPANHRLAGRSAVALGELAEENFILFDKGSLVHELSLEACQRAGFEPRVIYVSLRVESILGLVASNSGIALMMARIYAFHHPADTVAVPLAEKIESNLVLAWRKDRKLSRPARTFIEFIGKGQ